MVLCEHVDRFMRLPVGPHDGIHVAFCVDYGNVSCCVFRLNKTISYHITSTPNLINHAWHAYIRNTGRFLM